MLCVFGLVIFLALDVSTSSKCLVSELPCENGECVAPKLWCNTHKDCSDGTDEKYCKKSSWGKRDPNKCSSAYFQCANGPCIPKIGRCDGIKNCEDSSDEKKCESFYTTTKSSAEFQSFKSSTSGMKTSPISAAKPKLTSTSGYQTQVKTESHASRSFDSANIVQYSVDIQHSDLQPSDYSRQRENARNWLVLQRKSDFGWEDETPRALTALYLSDEQLSINRSENMLMVKQLEVQISLAMARNGTSAMELTELALYINALLASCKDPNNFYGENLVLALRNGVNFAQRAGKLVNPSVYMTLCMNKDITYDDTRKLHGILTDINVESGRTDVQALALLTATCIYKNTKFLTTAIYDELRKQFFQRMNGNGFPGNVYEASLLAQALHEMKITQPGLMEFIMKQQQDDGSFGGILATYLVLPVISGRSFLQLNTHCSQRLTTDLSPIEVMKNSKRKKIYVTYVLKYGNPPEITEIIEMQVPEGVNFFDVMRLAQEINPKYRFLLHESRDMPIVYSIGGIPNDAEKGLFWSLHLMTTGNRVKEDARSPYTGNIKELIPHSGDEFVFWMKSI